jgi:hypothetical protein
MVLRIKGELDLVAYCRRDGVGVEDKPSFPNVNANYCPKGCRSE